MSAISKETRYLLNPDFARATNWARIYESPHLRIGDVGIQFVTLDLRRLSRQMVIRNSMDFKYCIINSADVQIYNASLSVFRMPTQNCPTCITFNGIHIAEMNASTIDRFQF
mmetsp:Transcript_13990/g.29489  ORF Transcript_13990/g.29489 Transcript_13990/m.29489 type:complete len:112 (-) Transcript_13990:924-1259(-)